MPSPDQRGPQPGDLVESRTGAQRVHQAARRECRVEVSGLQRVKAAGDFAAHRSAVADTARRAGQQRAQFSFEGSQRAPAEVGAVWLGALPGQEQPHDLAVSLIDEFVDPDRVIAAGRELRAVERRELVRHRTGQLVRSNTESEVHGREDEAEVEGVVDAIEVPELPDVGPGPPQVIQVERLGVDGATDRAERADGEFVPRVQAQRLETGGAPVGGVRDGYFRQRFGQVTGDQCSDPAAQLGAQHRGDEPVAHPLQGKHRQIDAAVIGWAVAAGAPGVDQVGGRGVTAARLARPAEGLRAAPAALARHVAVVQRAAALRADGELDRAHGERALGDQPPGQPDGEGLIRGAARFDRRVDPDTGHPVGGVDAPLEPRQQRLDRFAGLLGGSGDPVLVDVVPAEGQHPFAP